MGQFSSTESTPDEIAALAGVYSLLARFWLREVDASLLEELHSPPLFDCFTQAGGILQVQDDAKTIEELAIDYCQLFVGPAGHLPPIQSVWQNGQLQGRAAASMKQWTEVIGYEIEVGAQATMLDHLGVQLDVMGRILRQSPVTRGKADRTSLPSQIAQTFFRQHLIWPARLLDVAIDRAQSKFYRSIIRMTRDFLESEQRYWMGAVPLRTP